MTKDYLMRLSQGSTKNLPELVSNFSKIAEYKVNIKNQSYFCILAMSLWTLKGLPQLKRFLEILIGRYAFIDLRGRGETINVKEKH